MGRQSLGVRSNLLLLGVLFVNNMSFVVSNGLASELRPSSTSEEDVYRYLDMREKREMKRAILQGLGLKHTIDVKKVSSVISYVFVLHLFYYLLIVFLLLFFITSVVFFL